MRDIAQGFMAPSRALHLSQGLLMPSNSSNTLYPTILSSHMHVSYRCYSRFKLERIGALVTWKRRSCMRISIHCRILMHRILMQKPRCSGRWGICTHPLWFKYLIFCRYMNHWTAQISSTLFCKIIATSFRNWCHESLSQLIGHNNPPMIGSTS